MSQPSAGSRRPVLEVSWSQALAWRLARQNLIERAPQSGLVDVVDRMCGLHAQVLSSVELALLARIDGLQAGALGDALWRTRTLVKTWAMRKTLHVFPSSRMGLWLGGLGTYREGPDWYHLRDPRTLELADLIGRALRGRVLTRSELAAEVGRLSGSPAMEEALHGSWGGNLKPASFLGRLCFAPNRGQQVCFAHPDTWLRTPPDTVDGADALAAITRRYLATYGPASAVDLGAWWGVGRTLARRMIAALDDAAEVDVEGARYWMLAGDIAGLASTTPVSGHVRLLPSFDPWVICASRRDRTGSRPGPGEPALNPAFRARVYRQQGWVSAILLVDGRMAGVWRHQAGGRHIRVTVEAFEELRPWAREATLVEAERVADFLGRRLALTFAS